MSQVTPLFKLIEMVQYTAGRNWGAMLGRWEDFWARGHQPENPGLGAGR